MVGSSSSSSNVHGVIDENSNSYWNMVMHARRINQGYVSECSIIDEESNVDVTRFFNLLKDYDEPLWGGGTNHSKLSAVA